MKIRSYLAGIPLSVFCVFRHIPHQSRKRRRHYKRQWIRAAALHTLCEYLWCLPGKRVFIEHLRGDNHYHTPVDLLWVFEPRCTAQEPHQDGTPFEQIATATRSQPANRLVTPETPGSPSCVPPPLSA